MVRGDRGGVAGAAGRVGVVPKASRLIRQQVAIRTAGSTVLRKNAAGMVVEEKKVAARSIREPEIAERVNRTAVGSGSCSGGT